MPSFTFISVTAATTIFMLWCFFRNEHRWLMDYTDLVATMFVVMTLCFLGFLSGHLLFDLAKRAFL